MFRWLRVVDSTVDGQIVVNKRDGRNVFTRQDLSTPQCSQSLGLIYC